MIPAPTYLLYRTGFAPTNGTSVQMQRLFGAWEDVVVHLMWDAKEAGPHSVRWSVNTDDGPDWRKRFPLPARVWQRCKRWRGVAWWDRERLNRAALDRALQEIPVQPRRAWIICYCEWDAIRALALWEAVGRPPFVLHVLDILESDLSEAKAPRFFRLIRAAGLVVCLNGLIEKEMKRAGAKATGLFPLCSDLVAQERTFPPGPLKVIMSGALYSKASREKDALSLLAEAWPEATRRFPGAELHYSGADSRHLPARLKPYVRDHGLLSFAEYQALLRACHLAYVPVSNVLGTPLRFSLPSRIPDYLICGLPVIGCTEEGTGIADFFDSAPADCTRRVTNAETFLGMLKEWVVDPERWEAASRAASAYSAAAFSIEAAREKLILDLDVVTRSAGLPAATATQSTSGGKCSR